MRNAGFTWEKVAEAKFPGIHWQCVRLRFLEQSEPRSEDSSTNATEASVQQTGHLSRINLAKTPRLQAAHDTQQPIADATYPGSSLDDIQAFRPTTAKRTNRCWTADEIRIITEEYDKGVGLKAISDKVPGRTLQAVSTIMGRYKRNDPALLKAMERQPWTDQEITRLLELRTAGLSWEEISPTFPNRSHASLKTTFNRIREDGIWPAKDQCQCARFKRYSAEEIEFLIDEATKGTPVKDIATSLNHSTMSLRLRLSKLKVKLPRDWTLENDKSLLQMLEEQYSFEQIAQKLGRTIVAVEARWRRIRPETSLTSPERTHHNSKTFQPSSVEMQDVARLRLEGRTWNDIAASMFPNIRPPHVRTTFNRAFKRGSLPTPKKPTDTRTFLSNPTHM